MHQRLHPVRFVGVVVVLASAPGLAMAYIDPGNGAYMVQVIFTLVGAGAFYIPSDPLLAGSGPLALRSVDSQQVACGSRCGGVRHALIRCCCRAAVDPAIESHQIYALSRHSVR